jgi:CRP/FNR family cyclic AMP-dependent transcriptional regulator
MKSFAPLRDAASVKAILEQISFLGGLSDDQLGTILGLLECATYKKGEIIAQRGEEPTHIFIIASGRVDLIIEDGDHTVPKRSFEVGDCFGEAAVLSLINNTASFIAAADCSLIAFSRKSLNRLHRDDPDLFCRLILNLARDLARKLQYTDEILLRR